MNFVVRFGDSKWTFSYFINPNLFNIEMITRFKNCAFLGFLITEFRERQGGKTLCFLVAVCALNRQLSDLIHGQES